jgi:hypothetical protein
MSSKTQFTPSACKPLTMCDEVKKSPTCDINADIRVVAYKGNIHVQHSPYYGMSMNQILKCLNQPTILQSIHWKNVHQMAHMVAMFL